MATNYWTQWDPTNKKWIVSTDGTNFSDLVENPTHEKVKFLSGSDPGGGAGRVWYNGTHMQLEPHIKTTGTVLLDQIVRASDSREVMLTADDWLRINQSGQFPNGIWLGSSKLKMYTSPLLVGTSGGDNANVQIDGNGDNINRIHLQGSTGNIYLAGYLAAGQSISEPPDQDDDYVIFNDVSAGRAKGVQFKYLSGVLRYQSLYSTVATAGVNANTGATWTWPSAWIWQPPANDVRRGDAFLVRGTLAFAANANGKQAYFYLQGVPGITFSGGAATQGIMHFELWVTFRTNTTAAISGWHSIAVAGDNQVATMYNNNAGVTIPDITTQGPQFATLVLGVATGDIIVTDLSIIHFRAMGNWA